MLLHAQTSSVHATDVDYFTAFKGDDRTLTKSREEIRGKFLV